MPTKQFLHAVEPELQQWLAELRVQGIDRSVPMRSPLPEAGKVSSGYGARKVAWDGKGPPPTALHEALDFTTVVPAAGRNIPIGAMVSGRVLYVGTPDDASGCSVIIGGDDGRVYSYAHLRPGSFTVHAGDHVGRGQALAFMGHSGTATADCVHVVMRELPLDGDYSKWSWKHRGGFLGDAISGAEFGRGLDAYVKTDKDHRITWKDYDRCKPRAGWDKTLQRHDTLPVNDQRDRYPHVYALRDYLVQHEPNHPLIRGMGLNPDSTAPSERLAKLDAQIKETSRRSGLAGPGSHVAPHPEWMDPNHHASVQPAKPRELGMFDYVRAAFITVGCVATENVTGEYPWDICKAPPTPPAPKQPHSPRR